MPGKGRVVAGKRYCFVRDVTDGSHNSTESGDDPPRAGEDTSMSQTEKLPALSPYERFVLESLYRQAATETGRLPDAQARQRIREEYIASLGKDIPQTRPYRRHKKAGDTEKTFHWQPCDPMRKIRPR